MLIEQAARGGLELRRRRQQVRHEAPLVELLAGDMLTEQQQPASLHVREYTDHRHKVGANARGIIYSTSKFTCTRTERVM